MFYWHRKVVRWFIGIVGGTLVGLYVALHSVSRAPILQAKLVEALNDKLDARVELQSFEVDAFPTLRIHGDGLKLRLKGQQNARRSSKSATSRSRAASSACSGASGVSRRWTSTGSASRFPRARRTTRKRARRRRTWSEGPVLIDRVTSRDAAADHRARGIRRRTRRSGPSMSWISSRSASIARCRSPRRSPIRSPRVRSRRRGRSARGWRAIPGGRR